MTLVAGVDSSTQGCKVVVCDLDSGVVLREGRANHPDASEVDPEDWLDALRLAVEGAGGLDDVVAVSVAAQQHGMIPLDERGRVIRAALLWNDSRSAEAAKALTAEFGADELARRTGSVPVASFTSSKLRWLRDAEPDNARRVRAVALPHDWITWRLRGFGPDRPDLDRLTTDRSDASGTGYWDPRGGYDREILVAALGRDVVVPEVLLPDARAGTLAGGAVLGAGAGDNAAAALGLQARVGDVVVSVGTSGTVFGRVREAVHDATGTVAGFADAEGGFLPLVATLNAARVLDVIARLLQVDHDGLADLALSAAPGADGVLTTPYFAGERTPDLPDATASIAGLTLANTTPANIARSAIEGMLLGLREGLEALATTGLRPSRAILIGGGARNRAVPPIAAAVLGLPIETPAPGEYVAIGAARQAAWSLTGELPGWQTTEESRRHG
jgi:xylulokinase